MFDAYNQERFWSMVEKTDNCWIWRGPFDERSGYGFFNYGKSSHKYAHRVSYEYANGIQPRRVRIYQMCQNTRCVRPDHLSTGKDDTLVPELAVSYGHKKT